ncbi:MAG: TatD family hydrolase [Prolixibacteraceae bacterium]
MKRINLHTHSLSEDNSIQIKNIFAQDFTAISPEYFFSVGLHPWHIGKVDVAECLLNLERASRHKNMLAVGECGLDRSEKTGFAVQEKIFQEQITIAEKYHKPLIIHNVRASSDLIKIRKDRKSGIPWILHGYHGNLETTLDLVRHGFYFSIGESLLKNESKRGLILQIPENRLFLETDDHEISIEKIYLLAAQILKTDEERLAESIFNNFKTLFGDDKLA